MATSGYEQSGFNRRTPPRKRRPEGISNRNNSPVNEKQGDCTSARNNYPEQKLTPSKLLPSTANAPSSACGKAFIPYDNATLETPLLHFAINFLVSFLRKFYSVRWLVTYPLQRRLPKSTLTYGEVTLILPFMAIFFLGFHYTFIRPSVNGGGMLALLTFNLAYITANRTNSVFSFLLGIPFERALLYHRMNGLLAFLVAALHGVVSYINPDAGFDGHHHHVTPAYSLSGNEPNFAKFSVTGKDNITGNILMILTSVLLLTTRKVVRRKAFEIFYYSHVFISLAIFAIAALHNAQIVGPVAGWWALDLFTRYTIMTALKYPKKASIQTLPGGVIMLSFPKTKDFEYQAGQYVFLAVPKLSHLQFHPFSISSSPHHEIVTIHIRVLGNWTRRLEGLAETTEKISILLEGPCGAPSVDLESERYKMIMLFSGGIGVTPMQSICNTLIHNQARGRALKKIWFVWSVRDNAIVDALGDPGKTSFHHSGNQELKENEWNDPTVSDSSKRDSSFDQQEPHDETSSRSYVGVGDGLVDCGIVARDDNVKVKDVQAETKTEVQERNDCDKSRNDMEKTPLKYDVEKATHKSETEELSDYVGGKDRDRSEHLSIDCSDSPAKKIPYSVIESPPGKNWSPVNGRRRCVESYPFEAPFHRNPGWRGTISSSASARISQPSIASSRLSHNSFTPDLLERLSVSNSLVNPDVTAKATNDCEYLHTEFYLTGLKKMKDPIDKDAMSPYVKIGRPDIESIFSRMKKAAKAHGEKTVAVCVCGPERMVRSCRKASKNFSTDGVRFDFHCERFEF